MVGLIRSQLGAAQTEPREPASPRLIEQIDDIVVDAGVERAILHDGVARSAPSAPIGWPGPDPTLDVIGGAEAILEDAADPLSSAPSNPPGPISDLAALVTPGLAADQLAQTDPLRPFSVWSRRYLFRTIFCDAVLGFLAVATPAAFSDTLSQQHVEWLVACLVGMVVWPLAVAVARGYDSSHVGVGGEELRAPMRAATGVVVIGAFTAEFSDQQTLLLLILLAAPTVLVYSLFLRYGLRKHLHFTQRSGRNLRRVIVAGGSASIRELSQRLQREAHFGMKVVGACLPKAELASVPDLGVPILGDLEYLSSAAREFGCDAVAVTSDDATRHSYLRKIAWSLEGVGIEMLVDPGLVDVAGPRMHIRPVLGFPLVHVEQPRFTGWRKVIKRLTDVGLTSFGLLIISPLLVVIAVAVKLADGGPVLFRQIRVGRGGRPFIMLKFRSMVADAEARKADLIGANEGHGPLFKLARDPRVTRIGQFLRDFSLDELPQLFNVLDGSMSLVGPRPHLADEIARMPLEASRRSLVTPGLTGLWQISGRSDLDAADAVRLDLRYVENWSFTLDLLILWKTAFAVLAKRGAH